MKLGAWVQVDSRLVTSDYCCEFVQADQSWKASLSRDSSLEDVLAATKAEGSLASLDGGLVDGALKTLDQARPGVFWFRVIQVYVYLLLLLAASW